MLRIAMLWVLTGALTTGAAAPTGLTYRFQADTLSGTVWVQGDQARRELEKGEGGTAAGRVEIWKDGGRQVFILNRADRTYYEERAFRVKQGLPAVSLEALTVRRPFRVERVERVHTDLKLSAATEVVSGYSCRRGTLTFSYSLELSVQPAASMPATVAGSEDFCLMDVPEAMRLPFGHQLELTSGHPEVDAAIAERLGPLQGVPVARKLMVTRQIERGEPVSAVSVLLLSDVRPAVIPPDRFEVPKDYQFREPVITPPKRKNP